MIRPEDHLGPETELFQRAYVENLRSNLKFHPRIEKKVNEALHEVAKKMQKKPKDVTYIGIHNRRTDQIPLLKKDMKGEDLEDLGVDFFINGMDYFR